MTQGPMFIDLVRRCTSGEDVTEWWEKPHPVAIATQGEGQVVSHAL